METTHILAAAVTPVGLISACGLITLALSNRLGAILGRIRAFQQQEIELLERFFEHGIDDRQTLVAMLHTQIAGVTEKAKMIQKGLVCLMASIGAFLFSSLFAGLTWVHPDFGLAAIVTGGLGIMLFLVGLGWAMRELVVSLVPLEEESAYLRAVSAYCFAKSQGDDRLKIAKTA